MVQKPFAPPATLILIVEDDEPLDSQERREVAAADEPLGGRTVKIPLYAALLLPCFVGCDRNDVQVLTRVGGALAGRAEGALDRAPKLRNPLAMPLPTSRRDRVLQRLLSDKSLAGVAIEVVETERGVRLLGTVPDEKAKFIALELARSTVEVEEVEDGLEVAEEND